MDQEMECMCLQCGISLHIGFDLLSLEDIADSKLKLVSNSYCVECGGALVLVGKAGDEANYRFGQ